MSWEASAWAKKTRGHRSHGSGRLLLVLADYHSHQSGCWPSQKTLAEDCEMPIRTVQWCLQSLEAQGFITTLQKGNQHQPTRYQLNFNVAVAHVCEPATSEPANITPSSEPARISAVNPQDGTSEPASPRITNLQEPPLEPPVLLSSIHPEWFQTLSQDIRWTEKNPDKYIRAVEQQFPGVNLDLEAHAAYEWLQTPKGRKKKVLRGFWRNWLKNSAKSLEGSQNGRTTTSSEPSPFTKYGSR